MRLHLADWASWQSGSRDAATGPFLLICPSCLWTSQRSSTERFAGTELSAVSEASAELFAGSGLFAGIDCELCSAQVNSDVHSGQSARMRPVEDAKELALVYTQLRRESIGRLQEAVEPDAGAVDGRVSRLRFEVDSAIIYTHSTYVDRKSVVE